MAVIKRVAVLPADSPSGQQAEKSYLRTQLRTGAIWSLIFQIASKSSLFVIGGVAARLLSVQDLGRLFATQGLLILLVAVADRGISLYLERNIAAARLRRGSLRVQFVVRAMESVASFGICFVGFTTFTTYSNGVCAWFSLAFTAMYFSITTNAALQGFQNFRTSALTQTTGRLVYLAAILLIVAADERSIAGVAAAWALGEITIAVTQSVWILKSRARGGGYAQHVYAAVPRDSAIRSYRRLAARAVPYWISVVAYLAYNRADSTIVLLFSNARQAGLYAPASNIQTALMVIPSALTGAMAVVGAAAIGRGEASTRDLLAEVKRLSIRAVLASLALAAAATAIAPYIILVFAGRAYQSSDLPTRIIVWSLPLNAVEFSLLGLLISLGFPGKTIWFYLTTLSASLVANAALTPHFGAVGGAWAAVIREPFGCAVLIYHTRRSIRGTLNRTPARHQAQAE
ncbi:polysaccharide biosynthesis C-terminal domain-containing protein [uncultured Jatrophihabitans sp.]|uniref:polysaccharide biosynthesis C-terminal domain-containing protein n=1 Tax=uncultured Jatrophihabitans sp. TaxID=1610747 RepID=UPI0035C9A594